MKELWTYAHTTMQQLEGVPDGSAVRIGVPSSPVPGDEGHVPGG